jgi:Pyridine nucleotide-disulphide oxidoreductase
VRCPISTQAFCPGDGEGNHLECLLSSRLSPALGRLVHIEPCRLFVARHAYGNARSPFRERPGRRSASRGAEFAVIGGGFIGPEMAASLTMSGCKVSLVFPGACIGDRLFPRPLANFLNVYFRKQGVDVRFCEPVRSVERRGDRLVVHTGSDDACRRIECEKRRRRRSATDQRGRRLPPATSPIFRAPRWSNAFGSNTRTTQPSWDARPDII